MLSYQKPCSEEIDGTVPTCDKNKFVKLMLKIRSQFYGF